MKHSFLKKRFVLPMTTALALAGIAGTAFAADSVSQTVNAGTRTASVADVTLTAVTYSHESQTNPGTLTLTADDSSGSDAGWNVTIQSGALTDGAKSIAASNLAITMANAPTMTAGQAVDATNGPMVPAAGATGTLDQAIKVVQANAGYGKGTYTQDLGVTLTIPAQQLAGNYVGTLTTTIIAAP